MNRKSLGDKGEKIARDFLVNKGYEIIGTNIRNKYGEIDILAKTDNTIVVVEVKTKTSNILGSPEDMVNFRKQKKLITLAKSLINEYPQTNIRIDTVAILYNGDKYCVNHILNSVEEVI